jgi:hypothetical protein
MAFALLMMLVKKLFLEVGVFLSGEFVVSSSQPLAPIMVLEALRWPMPSGNTKARGV